MAALQVFAAAAATTQAQATAIDDAYYSERWNGVDAALSGTALSYDFCLVRVNGSRKVTSYKNSCFADGAFGAINEAFDQSPDKYDGAGNKLPLYTEYQADGGRLIDAALLYSNPTLLSNSALAGRPLLDAGLFTLGWPLQYLDKSWGSNAMGDATAAAGAHAVTVAAPADPNFGGFPTQIGYGNPLHTNVFWMKDGADALLRLSRNAEYFTASPSSLLTENVSYRAAAKKIAVGMLGVARWLLYGGASGYADAAPFTDGNGGFVGGSLKALCDGYEAGLTHRLWTTAAALQSVGLLCSMMGIPNAEDLVWWSRHYARQAIAAQVATSLKNILGAPSVGLIGYYPEYASRDGVGFDLSYGATSFDYAITYYLECPDRNFADQIVKPSIDKAAAAYASRVAGDGTLNLWGDTRCNPYVVNDPTSAYDGLMTGLPIVKLPGTQTATLASGLVSPVRFAYSGETNQGTGAAKTPAYDTLAEAFLRLGKIDQALTGSDSHGYQLLGAKIALRQAFNYIPPAAQ